MYFRLWGHKPRMKCSLVLMPVDNQTWRVTGYKGGCRGMSTDVRLMNQTERVTGNWRILVNMGKANWETLPTSSSSLYRSNLNHLIPSGYYIVTCQPIVGLRNRGYATRFQAPAGKQDFRADAMTSRNSIGIRFLRNMPRWHHTHQE
jgi:hypothetical protein